MSYLDPSKSSESKPEDDGLTNASSPGPRSFLSLEREVRADIKCLVKDKVSMIFTIEQDNEEQDQGSKTPADELHAIALEFVACVGQEKRCASHRMRLRPKHPLAPGVIIDTPGTGLFFYRLWEMVVDEAIKSRARESSSKEKTCFTACDWTSLAAARAEVDRRTDRAIKLIKQVQDIKCEIAAGWSVWSRPGAWSDLPLLEHIFRDFQFALPSAIADHENISERRIQRYVCGATLPSSKQVKRGEVRDLLEMRWKWLQLQKLGALLWNDTGRAEYFAHAMRALDALVNFSPQEQALPREEVDSPLTSSRVGSPEASGEIGDLLVAVEGASMADTEEAPAANDSRVDWTEPPPTTPPAFLQLLLAEGAAIWLCEAMPVIRRYIEKKPQTELERTWFECARESEEERNDKWSKWREGLERVRDWCTAGNSGVDRKATVIASVARALEVMSRF